MLAIRVFEQSRGGCVERAWFAEDVARIDGAEFFLGKAALVGAVCVDGTERVPRQGVSELGYMGCDVAEGGQDFTQRGVFPVGNE